MGEWETREAMYEKAQEVDSTRRFKALARRNKLLGLWAAEKLGLKDQAAQDYANRLVETQVGEDNDEKLALWLIDELKTLDPPLSAHRIRRRLGELTAAAAKQVFEGR